MAYALNNRYRFKSHAGDSNGKYLNVYGNEVISNFRNVCLWDKVDGAYSQGWYIINGKSGNKIVTMLDSRYGLDFYHGKDNYANCDIYPEYGNDVDSLVVLEPYNESLNIYKIKLSKNSSYYLTSKGISNNSNVRWEIYNGSSSQLWKLEEWPIITKQIYGMYPIINQKYIKNDSWIQTYGCAVCCVCSVNSFYGKLNYDISQAQKDGMYSSYVGVIWSKVKYADCMLSNNSTHNGYLNIIKNEINGNRPVFVHIVGGNGREHWVIAYGYTDEGNTTSKILVLDSYNQDINKLYGESRNLYQSMDINYKCFTIKDLRITSKK